MIAEIRDIAAWGHAGLGAAPMAVFPAVPWQRCQFHLQQNAQAYVPRLDQRAAVAESIRTVFNCADRPAAQLRLKEIVALYAPTVPKLAGGPAAYSPMRFSQSIAWRRRSLSPQ